MAKFKAIDLITKEFDNVGVKYQVTEHGDSESVDAGFQVEGGSSVLVHFISTDNDNDVAIRIFNFLHDIPANKLDGVLKTINQANHKYRFINIVLDDTNDINVSYDLPTRVPDDSVGPICCEIFIRWMKILDGVYPDIMRTLWS